jgi:hypothetical protein
VLVRVAGEKISANHRSDGLNALVFAEVQVGRMIRTGLGGVPDNRLAEINQFAAAATTGPAC